MSIPDRQKSKLTMKLHDEQRYENYTERVTEKNEQFQFSDNDIWRESKKLHTESSAISLILNHWTMTIKQHKVKQNVESASISISWWKTFTADETLYQ